MTRKKTRPDPDSNKTIGEIANEVRELERIKEYLGGETKYGRI